MICAVQSPLKRTDLSSAVFQSSLGDNCNEIQNKINQQTLSLMAICLSFTKKKRKSALAISTKSRGKKIPNEGIHYLLWNSAPVLANESAGRSGIHVLAHLEASSSLIYDCV